MQTFVLAILLFSVSCSHIKNRVLGYDENILQGYPNLTQVKAEWGEPKQCVNYGEYAYCTWNNEKMQIFLNGKYVESKTLSFESGYEVEANSMGEKGNLTKAFVAAGDENINPDGLEWRQTEKLFKALLISEGFTIVNKVEESNVIVKFRYGISDKIATFRVRHGVNAFGATAESQLNNRRFLSVIAYETAPYLESKKSLEIWKVLVTSIGPSVNVVKALPVMTMTAKKYVGKTLESTEVESISDGEVSVEGFKHYASHLP